MNRRSVDLYPALYKNELYAPMNSWFDQMMTSFFPELKPFDFNTIKSRAYPKVDIRKQDKDIIVEASVPFLKKENLDISLDRNILIISGKIERKTEEEKQNYYHSELTKSSFSRSLPIDIDLFDKWVDKVKNPIDNIDAYLKDGVLTIYLKDILSSCLEEKSPVCSSIPIKEIEE